MSAALIIAGSHRTVVPSYRLASLSWIAGENLYDGTGRGFIYLPQAGLLFMPFAVLPQVLGEVLWRLITIGTFAVGIQRFARFAGERSHREFFPLMSLVSIPLAWDGARNGQATLALTGLMLLAVVDVGHGRWWRATLWLSLGLALKPLMIVLVLLIMAIHRPMTGRALLGLAAVALLPFLAQHHDYVVRQYAEFFGNALKAVHVGAVSHGWATPFAALRLAGVDLPERIQTALRVVGALLTLALCVAAHRRYDGRRSAIFVFSLSVLYLMLFNPRTENNTYAMLGPALAIFLSAAFLMEKRFVEGGFLVGIVLALISQRPIQNVLAPGTEKVWLSPILAAIFGLYLLARLLSGKATEAG